MQTIFNDYGIEIGMIENKYIIRIDSGEIASTIEEFEISKEDAEKAQISSQDAYEVLIKLQNNRIFNEGLNR